MTLPVPQTVVKRSSRCRANREIPITEGEGFRPVTRDASGNWQDIPLQAMDASCLDLALSSVFEFASRSYAALRTIPVNPWISEDALPPDGAWTSSDTAAALRARGEPSLRFLSTPADAAPTRTQRAAFLTNYFSPLLTPTDVQVWLQSLLVRAENGDSIWRTPITSTSDHPVPFVAAFAQVVQPFFERMAVWYNPPSNTPENSAWSCAFAIAFGVVAVTAVPLRSIYEVFHGTAAIESVEPNLEAAADTVRQALTGSWLRLLGVLDPDMPDMYRTLMERVLDQRAAAACLLYREVLDAPARSYFPRTRSEQGSLETGTEQWSNLEFKPGMEISSIVDYKLADSEVYWGHDVGWNRVMQAGDYVNQAGFALIINAANNRWGGRHPPHTTHQNGFDFDLDVAIPSKPGSSDAVNWGQKDKDFRVMANLAKLRKVPNPKGAFVDETGQRFDMQPVPGQKPGGPLSLMLLDRLALWVALQALQLVGMSNVLYADFDNMEKAVTHLVGRLQKSSPGKAVVATAYKNLPARGQPRQLLEPIGHYDHIHAECPQDLNATLTSPPGFTGAKTWKELNSNLLEFSKPRDEDGRFLDLMFGTLRKDISQEEAAYREFWINRSKSGGPGPSLLPVWDPTI